MCAQQMKRSLAGIVLSGFYSYRHISFFFPQKNKNLDFENHEGE